MDSRDALRQSNAFLYQYDQATDRAFVARRDCIYRGVLLLVGFTAILDGSVHVRALRQSLVRDAGFLVAGYSLVGAAALVNVVRFILLLLSWGRLDSYAVHVGEFLLWYAGYSILLMALAAVASSHVVLSAVATAAAIIAIASAVAGAVPSTPLPG